MMKIFCQDDVIFDLNESKKRVLLNKISVEKFDETIKEMVRWCLQSYCDQAYENLKKEWLPILFKRLKSIPTDEDELVNLILSQPDYRNYSEKQSDEKVKKESTFTVL